MCGLEAGSGGTLLGHQLLDGRRPSMGDLVPLAGARRCPPARPPSSEQTICLSIRT
jgi:hypothetical protein